MLKFTRVLVIVFLVSLVSVSVYAAVAWQWTAGDSCDIWEDSCSGSGIELTGDPAPISVYSYPLGVVASDIPAYVTTDCESGRFIVMDGGSVVYSPYFDDLPYTVTMQSGYRLRLLTYGPMCYVTDIRLGDPYAAESITVPGFSSLSFVSHAAILAGSFFVLLLTLFVIRISPSFITFVVKAFRSLGG